MIKRHSIPALLAASLVIVACGGGTPAPAATAPTESTTAEATPAPASAPAASSEASTATPAPASSAATAAAAPQTSKVQIDGVSISDITGDQLAAALKKRGWDAQTTPENHIGKYEQISCTGRKDKTKEVVTVTVSRTSKTPKPVADGTTEADFAPKKLQEGYAKTDKLAQAYDADGDVLVSLMYVKGGNTAAAKTALDGILKAK